MGELEGVKGHYLDLRTPKEWNFRVRTIVLSLELARFAREELPLTPFNSFNSQLAKVEYHYLKFGGCDVFCCRSTIFMFKGLEYIFKDAEYMFKGVEYMFKALEHKNTS